jgi:hypothetical protein
MWVGDDGVMKTTLDLLRGLAVAGGHALFNRFDTIQGPVMIVSGEDPEGVLRNRADAICRGHGWNADATLANVHVLCLAGVDMREREWQDRILAAAREIKPVLVIFDPLAEIATGDENSNSERSALARAFRRICGEVGASVDIVAHYKKPQGDNPDARKADRIRGANAIAKASRTTYAVERGPDDTIIVECLKFSRGKLRDRFAVRPYIVTAEDNEAIWHSARFEYVSVQEAVLDAAHTFVLEQLAGGVRMSTTDLKEAATASNQRRPSGSKISGVSISRAIKVLEMRKAIDFTPGDKGAKQWGLCLPGNLGNQNNVLAGQPDCLPGNHSGDESCLPSPLMGGNQASRTSEVAA